MRNDLWKPGDVMKLSDLNWRKGAAVVWRLSLFLFVCVNGSFAYGQEVYVAGGLVNRNDDGEQSYSWLISYYDEISDHFGWSLSWLNEGHLPDHHRDGPSLQLWVRQYVINRQLSFALGAGPYFAFDSSREGLQGDNYKNVHELGGLLSLTAGWHMTGRWQFQTRLENVWLNGGIDTTSVLLGVGYDLMPDVSDASEGPMDGAAEGVSRKNEITLFLGSANINGPAENDLSVAVEYRRNIFRFIHWTAGWLHEADNATVDRQGFVTQLWAEKRFFSDRLGLGAGLGIYLFKDDAPDPKTGVDDDFRVAGLAALTVSYRLPWNFIARGTWNRVITDYDRDSDVFLVGMGYRF
jgi:hypothetical protein